MTTKIPASPGVSAHTLITLDPVVNQVVVDVARNEQGAYFSMMDGVKVVEPYKASPNENIVFELDPSVSWLYQTSPDGIKWWNQFTIKAHAGQGWRVNFVLDNQVMPEAWARWVKV